MKVADYLVDYLITQGVTDVFGIPGGVVLEFLYALDKDSRINAHLSYHEQGAAFEACGYAQYEHKLGVAYATRGPGFTNLITAIADAYADSLPVLFITAHSGKTVGHEQRFEKDQELDSVSMVKDIVKYAATVDHTDFVCKAIQTACHCAVSGRKGPVLLDFSASLWGKDVDKKADKKKEAKLEESVGEQILDSLQQAKRPIFLVGDGIRQANAVQAFTRLCKKLAVPVLSSRCSQDVGVISDYYYGYVGSHGIRYSNFIFAKADLVIALGNRLGFPLESRSFTKALANKKIIRIENDVKELQRKIPNTKSFYCDVGNAIERLTRSEFLLEDNSEWLGICATLKRELKTYDVNDVVDKLIYILKQIDPNTTICCDVGNNEFWVSRAYVEADIKNRILYSKSFGTLGCSLPKSIGVALASKKPVLCIVGDHGLQLNMQELQLIVQEQIPICVLVINNYSSGMIRDREKIKFAGHYVHTTLNSGYGTPDFFSVATAYKVPYEEEVKTYPSIVELMVNEEIGLEPGLPAGRDCQDMEPYLERRLYDKLNVI